MGIAHCMAKLQSHLVPPPRFEWGSWLTYRAHGRLRAATELKFGWKKDTSLFLQFQRKTFGVVFEYAAAKNM